MAPPPPTPAITFSVQPTSIVAGQSATLTWSASNAASCTASGAWSGTEPTSGTMVVTPGTVGDNTYMLSCTDPVSGPDGGSATTSSMSVTLTVNAATVFAMTNLVADAASGTVKVDTNLVNPWGITFLPGAPVWVANNRTGTSTLYDGTGAAQPAGTPLVVHLPSSSGGAAFAPTGIVGNTTTDFVVSEAAKSAAAPFIFSGEGGMIAGWSKNVDVEQRGGHVYRRGWRGLQGTGDRQQRQRQLPVRHRLPQQQGGRVRRHLHEAACHQLYLQGPLPAGWLRALWHPGTEHGPERRGSDLRDLRHAAGAGQPR